MAEFPSQLTIPLKEVLALPSSKTGQVAEALRLSGHDIPRRIAAEQAYALHWMICLALEHGEDWWQAGLRQLFPQQERTPL